MVIHKSRLLITTLVATVFLCSCFSNRKLDYDYGEAEGYRFYQGFYSSLSDGSDKKPLFESITIDGIDYSIDVDNIATFYYEDYVACLYKYSENKCAFIDYEIKNNIATLVSTYDAPNPRSVCFMVPNYYPVFSVSYQKTEDVISIKYYLYNHLELISSDDELQSINSYGYFTSNNNKTTYTSFHTKNVYDFKKRYKAINNVRDLKEVILTNNHISDNVENIIFDSVTLEEQTNEKHKYCVAERTISYPRSSMIGFMYCDYSIWIENIDNKLYLTGLGIDKTFIMKTPDNYTPIYQIEYYKNFHLLTLEHSKFSLTYSLDYKSVSDKTLQYFRDPFGFQLFEDERYIFSSENIYRRVGPMGELTLDSYLIRFDKTNNKNEIMQKQYVYGLSGVLSYGYVLTQ